jgi:hypothetical protein
MWRCLCWRHNWKTPTSTVHKQTNNWFLVLCSTTILDDSHQSMFNRKNLCCLHYLQKENCIFEVVISKLINYIIKMLIFVTQSVAHRWPLWRWLIPKQDIDNTWKNCCRTSRKQIATITCNVLFLGRDRSYNTPRSTSSKNVELSLTIKLYPNHPRWHDKWKFCWRLVICLTNPILKTWGTWVNM